MKQIKNTLVLGMLLGLAGCGGAAPNSDGSGSSSGAITSPGSSSSSPSTGSTSGSTAPSSSGTPSSSGAPSSSGTPSSSGSPSTGSSSGSTTPSSSGLSGASGTSSSSGGATASSSSGSSVPSSSSGSGTGAVQAGTLTAGDYDDVLNFTLYQDYISDYLQTASASVAVPYVDITQKIPVKILDASGAAAKGAKITLSTEEKVLASLRTPADGVVNIYPVFDQLPASFQINITPPDGGAAITKTLLREQLTPGNKIEITLPTTVAANTNIDVTLVLDTTNSMADEIKYLQAELAQVFNDIAADYAGASIRVGLVAYRDEGDIYVHKEFPFTEDLTRFNADLASLFAGGGGDAPEAMDQGMNGALSLNWRENSTKIMLLVADAPPHNYEIAATWKAALKAREQQIHIVPVGASGLGKR
ncbi:MAG TPA: VWA domain-containing protein, partial [Marinagarivorans sp.]|nr:VWA domain-containing protein [Marinagarivorans sp.]